MGGAGHVIAQEALISTGSRKPSLGKCLWASVDVLGGPMPNLGLAGMMDPRGHDKRCEAPVSEFV